MTKEIRNIIYSRKENTYPLTEHSFAELTNQIENSMEWEVNYKDENITILKRVEE